MERGSFASQFGETFRKRWQSYWRPAETSADQEAADWQEDIFGGAWGTAAASTATESATESVKDSDQTYQAKRARVAFDTDLFNAFGATLGSILGSSGLASCCAGLVHFHGSSFGGLGHSHDEEEHRPSPSSRPQFRAPHRAVSPTEPVSPRSTSRSAARPVSGLMFSGESVSLGNLVASFASPDILAA